MLATPSPLWRNTAEKTPPGGEMEGILTVWRKKLGLWTQNFCHAAGMNLDYTFRQSEAIFYIKHFLQLSSLSKDVVMQGVFVHIFLTFILIKTEVLSWNVNKKFLNSSDSFIKKPAAIFHHHHLHQILWFSLDWVYNCFTLMTVCSALNEVSNRINWPTAVAATPALQLCPAECNQVVILMVWCNHR